MKHFQSTKSVVKLLVEEVRGPFVQEGVEDDRVVFCSPIRELE